MIRLTAAALAPLVLLAACGEAQESSDPYAGLDAQIRAWRNDLEANHRACAEKVAGKGCESFEVTCKAAQEITPQEAAAGINAQVVAAMRFYGVAAGSAGKPVSAFAEFSRAGGAWSRREAQPVNMSSCAPF